MDPLHPFVSSEARQIWTSDWVLGAKIGEIFPELLTILLMNDSQKIEALSNIFQKFCLEIEIVPVSPHMINI